MLYLYNNKKTAVYAVFSSSIYDNITVVNYFEHIYEFNTLATEFMTLAIRPMSRSCSTV